ncbi:hypothetical protein CARUB_v10010035mg [Capsella rubella]|uniref:RING-type domain-containing protein n=1 Tax=Capsella rubella TaxID=81985 RepID=R0GM63_9BRAS|nr:uncharacterized protein LOC17897424 [Capsella rubella]EOA37007.1 hypothetical protein CARUB_v10010035mg [Capsella rubella]
MYNQLAISSSSSSSSSSSYYESLKILEADVQHANSLAEAIPMGKNNVRLQMKLVHSNFASLLLILLQWIDLSCSCLIPRYLNLFHVLVYKVQSDGQPKLTTHGRKATISEFYGVILPSLQLLHSSNLDELQSADIGFDLKRLSKKITKEARSSRFTSAGLEREEECGICLETCTKMVLPNCCHSMCIKCYRNWNLKSQSCPFCRGSMKRVNSEDLWVLAGDNDVVDARTASREDLFRFYLYINSLPKDYPEALFLVYYEYSNLL